MEIEFPDNKEEQQILSDLVMQELDDNDLDFTLPSYIYHYTSTAGVKGILESNSLWFTHFGFLNDKSERYYAYNLFKECLGEEKNNINENFFNNIMSEICIDGNLDYEAFTKATNYRDYYVCSFSSSDNSLNMWNYYTKSADKTGYNIKFNVKQLISGLNNKSFFNYKVNYDADVQKKVYKSYILNFNHAWDDNKSQKFLKWIQGLLLDTVDLRSLIFKHPAFSNEQEFRIVFSIDRRNSESIKKLGLMKFRESKGILVPYLEVKFDKTAIEEIKISPTQQDILAKKGILMMLDSNNYSHVLEKNITTSDIPLRA